MRADLEFNIKFIQMVKERPSLYDNRHSDYNNRRIHDKTWRDISAKLNESVYDCKERWRHLRGCYTRHLKNQENTSRFFKPYYLAEFLSFLNGITKSKTSYDLNEMEQHLLEAEQDNSSEAADDDEYETVGEFETVPCAIKTDKKDHNTCEPNKIQRPKRVFVEDSEANSVEYGKLPKLDDTQDPDVAFLYSLLPDLKDMRTDQKRKFKIGAIKLICNIMEQDTLASPTSSRT